MRLSFFGWGRKREEGLGLRTEKKKGAARASSKSTVPYLVSR